MMPSFLITCAYLTKIFKTKEWQMKLGRWRVNMVLFSCNSPHLHIFGFDALMEYSLDKIILMEMAHQMISIHEHKSRAHKIGLKFCIAIG